LISRNTLLDEKMCDLLEQHSVDQVKVRSVITCDTDFGVCAHCYGRDLARGHLVNLGESVGVIAAQSIGEPGTQVTMGTFHIGGTATGRAGQTNLLARFPGEGSYSEAKIVQAPRGLVVMGRKAEIVVPDPKDDRERERHTLLYGSIVKFKDGEIVKAGDILAEWDPFSIPILSEVGGTVQYQDLDETTLEEK